MRGCTNWVSSVSWRKKAALSFARDRGVEVNVFHENVALSAYEHCEWELALHRLEWVQLRRILPSLVSYNTLIRAFEAMTCNE